MDRLRMDRLDLILIHNLHGLDPLMPAFIVAKGAGTVRYVGMSTSSESQYPAQMEAMHRYPLDFIQVDYSIANRCAADAIIPVAADRGMAVMINVPFGGRGGGAAATFGRVASRELPDWAAEADIGSWAQFFLTYVVSHPAVTVAIPGPLRERQARLRRPALLQGWVSMVAAAAASRGEQHVVTRRCTLIRARRRGCRATLGGAEREGAGSRNAAKSADSDMVMPR